MLGLSTALLVSCSVPQGDRFADRTLSYSVELPAGWRQMIPSEARSLKPRMPEDIATLLVLDSVERFAAVDDWLSKEFDGRCLTVTRGDGEPELTEATLQQVRDVTHARRPETGTRNEIDDLKIGSVGKRNHPAIESSFVVRTKDGQAIARVLEFLVPTGGKTLRFSYRASPQDFAAAEPVFRRCAATLQIAAPPEGRKELSDKLKMPLIIGGVVGLIFLVLYKLRKG